MAAITGKTGRLYGAPLLVEDCEDTWGEHVEGGVTLSTITGKDINGGNAVRATAVTVGAGALLMSEAITKNLTAYHGISFWVRSSVNTAAGDLRLLLDDNAECVSPLENLLIPALTANTWRLCNLRLATPSLLGAVISVGLYQQVNLADGTFDVDSVYALKEVAGIKNWSVDYAFDPLDVTDYQSDGVREVIAGRSQWSGSFDGDKDGAPLSVGVIVYVALNEDKSSNAGTWVGQALLTGISAAAPSDGVVTYSYKFEGTGPLEIPTA